MAHELRSNDYMFSGKGIKAWHGLGATVDGLLNADEALEAARLTWQVEKKAIMVAGGRKIPDMFATVRSDDQSVLGIVGDQYNVLQNADAFKFFDAVTQQGDAVYETAGSLFGGRRVFITASIPGLIRVGTGDDVLEQYLLLTNSHDGTSAVTAKLVTTRVVCNNTLSVALRERGTSVSIRHSRLMHDRLELATEVMGIANGRLQSLTEELNAFANHRMTDEQVRAFFNRTFGVKGVANDRQHADQEADVKDEKRAIPKLIELYESGAGAEMARGTLWGALNAVTEWTSHYRTYKQHEGGNDKADNKLNSLWFGQSATLADKAMAEARKLVTTR